MSDEQHDTIPGSLDELRPWLRKLDSELKANTEATRRIEANTAAIVKAFEAAQGFWSTVAWIGDAGLKVVKLVGVLAVAGGAMWLWIKGLFDGRAAGG